MKCEWVTCELGKLLTFQRGYDLPRTSMVEGRYPVIGSNGIIGYHNEYTTEAPSVSIGRSGNVGKPFIYYGRTWSHNTTLYVKDFKDSDPVFIFYLLKSLDLGNFAGGSAVPTLNRNHIHNLNVFVPKNKIDQRRIGSYLKLFDDKIELNNKINANLEQQAQALFKAWFVDNPDASSWQAGTFADLVERAVGGDWGKDLPSGNNTEMVYCIRGADIPEVRVGNKGKMPTRYIPPKNYAAKKLMDGDIVVEISGGSPTQSTGRAAVVSAALLSRYDKGMVCSNFCKALKPIAGFSMYVYYYWQYLYDMGVFFSYENGTTGIKNLDIKGFLETEPISIAPVELVRRFDCFVRSLFSEVYVNGLENERLALTRDTLLPYLMSESGMSERLGE